MITDLAAKSFLILAFFLVLFTYTKLAGPIPFSVSSVVTNKSEVFSVTGTGEISTKPDIAVVLVGVETSAQTVKEAQSQLNSRASQVASQIKKLGIEEKDIKTSNYNIYPQIDYQNNQRISSYRASTNFKITVRDLDNVNLVVDTATLNGANTIGGVSFDIEDKTIAENEAREKAVSEAKQKAQNAANIAGFRLGKIISYSESFGGSPRITSLEVKTNQDSTSIEPGSNTVRVQVTLSYELQ